MGTTVAAGGRLTLETISDPAAFARLDTDWDRLVRAMPRPSPFLLHGWLSEWWRHYGERQTLAVEVAYRDGQLVGALPVCVTRRRGLRVLTFLCGRHSALADLLVAPGEEEAAAAIAQQAADTEHDFADLFGLPGGSKLVEALGDSQLRVIERVESPVLEIDGDWDEVYRSKMSSKKRSEDRRRTRNLARLGTVEVSVATTHDELEAALADALELHLLRWRDRPDGSELATPQGRAFVRSALLSLADDDVPRIVTLKVDGRAIAFKLYFALEGRMYFYRSGFDPAFARFSPGVLTTLASIEVGTREGARRVEFLGGAERYKLELADRFDPMYEGFGLETSVRGGAAVRANLGVIRLRRQLKQSRALHHFYMDGLAPARRLLGRLS
ncbi:MAG TPA: GNAT family N-acetyltransferase [Gaiellaceae bacterium]|nr:GNAT family N-acetyltransferase [Gaiellaceae bacterium]